MATTSINALLKILQEAAMPPVDKVPSGWFTACELAKVAGKKHATGLRLANAGMKSGILECRRFRIKCGKSVRTIKHYRQK